MENQKLECLQILNEKSTIGISTIVDVRSLNNLTVVIGTSNSCNATIKVKGALGKVDDIKGGSSAVPNNRIDFASAQSITNCWDYIESFDQKDSLVQYKGANGIVYTGTDGVSMLHINVDSIDFICLHITAISTGKISAYISGNNF